MTARSPAPGVTRMAQQDPTRPQRDPRLAPTVARTARRNLDHLLTQRRPGMGGGKQPRVVRQCAVLCGPHQKLHAARTPAEQRVDVAFPIAHRYAFRGVWHSLGCGIGRPQPAMRFLVLEVPLASVRGALIRPRPDLRIHQTQHGILVGIHRHRGVDEEAGGLGLPARRTQAARLPAGEVHLRGVLRRDDPPARYRLGGVSGKAVQRLARRHMLRRQNPVRREFAAPVDPHLADHYRTLLDHRPKRPLHRSSPPPIAKGSRKLVHRATSIQR